MGAITIDITGTGYDLKEVFKNLQDEARQETGEDYYSGGINNCVLHSDITNMGDKKAVKYATDMARPKAHVYGWCTVKPVHNSNKTKSKVSRNVNKGTRVWKTVFIAETFEERYNIEDATLKGCIDKARAAVEKNNSLDYDIKIRKVLVKGESTCARVEYKRSKNQRPGTYRFVGTAPY